MVTPVGASADLVGDCGILAKSPRSDDLFAAMTAMLAQSTEMRMALGIAARQRIVNHFSIEVVAKRYLNLYALAADRSAHV